ncbi:MAG: phosphoribosyltransferase family protein [Patescibacteria group bacterium]
MADEIIVSYDEYHDLVLEELARKIEAAGKKPDQIITALRGGSFAGIVLSYYWGIPFATIAVQSRDENGDQVAEEDVFISEHIVNTAPEYGRHPLLIDDLTDSGLTLRLTGQKVREKLEGQIDDLIIATIFAKTCSDFTPDFIAKKVEACPDGKYPWIRQPWERK